MRKIFNFPEKHPILALLVVAFIFACAVIFWLSFNEAHFNVSCFILAFVFMTAANCFCCVMEGCLNNNLPGRDPMVVLQWFRKKEYDHTKICVRNAKISFIILLLLAMTMLVLIPFLL